MNAKSSTPHPVLTSTAAQLYVADVPAACAYFTGKLGFTVDFSYGEPPYYAHVSRDAALLALRLVCEPVFAADVREREALLSASITVETADEIKRLFADFEGAGARFHQVVEKQPWGAATFIVVDPDGNLILFAGPAH